MLCARTHVRVMVLNKKNKANNRSNKAAALLLLLAFSPAGLAMPLEWQILDLLSLSLLKITGKDAPYSLLPHWLKTRTENLIPDYLRFEPVWPLLKIQQDMERAWEENHPNLLQWLRQTNFRQSQALTIEKLLEEFRDKPVLLEALNRLMTSDSQTGSLSEHNQFIQLLLRMQSLPGMTLFLNRLQVDQLYRLLKYCLEKNIGLFGQIDQLINSDTFVDLVIEMNSLSPALIPLLASGVINGSNSVQVNTVQGVLAQNTHLVHLLEGGSVIALAIVVSTDPAQWNLPVMTLLDEQLQPLLDALVVYLSSWQRRHGRLPGGIQAESVAWTLLRILQRNSNWLAMISHADNACDSFQVNELLVLASQFLAALPQIQNEIPDQSTGSEYINRLLALFAHPRLLKLLNRIIQLHGYQVMHALLEWVPETLYSYLAQPENLEQAIAGLLLVTTNEQRAEGVMSPNVTLIQNAIAEYLQKLFLDAPQDPSLAVARLLLEEFPELNNAGSVEAVKIQLQRLLLSGKLVAEKLFTQRQLSQMRQQQESLVQLPSEFNYDQTDDSQLAQAIQLSLETSAFQPPIHELGGVIMTGEAGTLSIESNPQVLVAPCQAQGEIPRLTIFIVKNPLCQVKGDSDKE